MTMTADSRPDLGFPLPDGAPETAHCDWCGAEDRTARMYHAGNSSFFCAGKVQCQQRWEDGRAARRSEKVADGALTAALREAADVAAAALRADEEAGPETAGASPDEPEGEAGE